MNNKVFVIALDGVGFELVTPWLDSGKLPCLAGLVGQGAHGTLRSTIPPLTGPAWTSFQTGVNPGKHGIFSWTKPSPESYKRSVVSSDDISCPTLWELAGESGRQVVSIGVPMTYPARPVNGIIIPGLLTPRGDASPTYPANVYKELRRVAPDFNFYPHSAHRLTARAKIKELVKAARARTRTAAHFMEQYDWDLFMVHFQSTDSAQHELWGETRRGEHPLLQVFQEVDRLLAGLIERAQKHEATVIILSDHGMGPQEWTLSINTWLLYQGYLSLRRGLSTSLRYLLFRIGWTQSALKRVGLLFFPLIHLLGAGRTALDFMGDTRMSRLYSSLFLSLNDVDWKKTYAYSDADIGHIYLNLRGREPEGMVSDGKKERVIEELISALKATVNPYTEESLLGVVFRREEVYHGEQCSQAPDILFLSKDLRTIGSGTWQFYSNRALDRAILPAHHRMDGILAAVGTPFKPIYHMQGASLIDVTPNILYLLDCPIPRYMDGRLWKDAFLPGTLSERPPRWSDRSSKREEAAYSGRTGDDEELKRRLRALGYLN